MRNRRRKYAIDAPVQGALTKRLIAHWLSFFALCILLLPLWRLLSGATSIAPFSQLLQEAWAEVGAVILLMLLLLPMFVWDTIKLSHKFVGPVYRFRKAFKAMAAGEDVQPINLRKGDFWQDVAEDFNAALTRLNATKRPQPPAPASESDQHEAQAESTESPNRNSEAVVEQLV